MILIISQNYHEYSADDVADWITYKEGLFAKLNGVDFLTNASIAIDNKGSQILIEGIDWNEINVVWFRRWASSEEGRSLYFRLQDNKRFLTQINNFLRSEYNAITSFFLDSIKHILFSSVMKDDINKLMVLKKAAELGIKIPYSFITSTKSNFLSLAKEEELITKAISNSRAINIDNKTYVSYTSECTNLPEEVNDSFAPSLFQSNIKKKQEIRSFYLNGKFYSMAIFSQNDEQTKVDFRRYNYGTPNRTVPFKLPQNLEGKLDLLAKSFNQRSGSFDIIRTMEDEYVLLEINPEGQFGMVSYPCNYYLERELADELIKIDHNG